MRSLPHVAVGVVCCAISLRVVSFALNDRFTHHELILPRRCANFIGVKTRQGIQRVCFDEPLDPQRVFELVERDACLKTKTLLDERVLSKATHHPLFSVGSRCELRVKRVPPRVASILGLKLPLNEATQDELEALPHIGPARANAILEYRRQHGKFVSVSDLEQIHGIGHRTVEKLKDYLVVERK